MDTFYYPTCLILMFNVIRSESSNTGFLILCSLTITSHVYKVHEISKYLNLYAAILNYFLLHF